MTELELENKATLYANEHCEDKDEDGFWLTDEEMLRRAFIAGAKAMQDDKERVKSELETNISSLKEIVELLQQIEKMKYCHSCKSYELNNLKNCQTCDGNYSNWELAE